MDRQTTLSSPSRVHTSHDEELDRVAPYGEQVPDDREPPHLRRLVRRNRFGRHLGHVRRLRPLGALNVSAASRFRSESRVSSCFGREPAPEARLRRRNAHPAPKLPSSSPVAAERRSQERRPLCSGPEALSSAPRGAPDVPRAGVRRVATHGGDRASRGRPIGSVYHVLPEQAFAIFTAITGPPLRGARAAALRHPFMTPSAIHVSLCGSAARSSHSDAFAVSIPTERSRASAPSCSTGASRRRWSSPTTT